MKYVDDAKRNGVHYTPKELASFFVRSIVETGVDFSSSLSILDPACGDGGLLAAFVEATPQQWRQNIVLTGYDQDPTAIQVAQKRLGEYKLGGVRLKAADFLLAPGLLAPRVDIGNPREGESDSEALFDVIVSNPPYVRTQVLGAPQSQALAKRFGITGRVDLYHAFTIAMTSVLRDSGHIGLLTSNRFLSVRSGRTMREFLMRNYQIQKVVDLGDSRLFTASVLPVIIAGRKRSVAEDAISECDHEKDCKFLRVYEARNAKDSEQSIDSSTTVLGTLGETDLQGKVTTDNGTYEIQRGALRLQGDEKVWTIATSESDRFLKCLRKYRQIKFGSVANVKVGVKTTADNVFIRTDWSTLAESLQPESALVHPLLTHHDAVPWATSATETKRKILYPYCLETHPRQAIRLDDFPQAKCYLKQHEQRLKSRKYLIEGGREWFEIWVPHTPNDWQKRKIVFPDISENPTFFLDDGGRIVNGDCYWLTLKEGVPEDYWYLILGIANSDFACRFYDIQFCNKLYSGRRRFMTQYVKQFPLPELESKVSQRIINEVKAIVFDAQCKEDDQPETFDCEKRSQKVSRWVDEAFGLA